jgi:hypothetical protein
MTSEVALNKLKTGKSTVEVRKHPCNSENRNKTGKIRALCRTQDSPAVRKRFTILLERFIPTVELLSLGSGMEETELDI